MKMSKVNYKEKASKQTQKKKWTEKKGRINRRKEELLWRCSRREKRRKGVACLAELLRLTSNEMAGFRTTGTGPGMGKHQKTRQDKNETHIYI